MGVAIPRCIRHLCERAIGAQKILKHVMECRIGLISLPMLTPVSYVWLVATIYPLYQDVFLRLKQY